VGADRGEKEGGDTRESVLTEAWSVFGEDILRDLSVSLHAGAEKSATFQPETAAVARHDDAAARDDTAAGGAAARDDAAGLNASGEVAGLLEKSASLLSAVRELDGALGLHAQLPSAHGALQAGAGVAEEWSADLLPSFSFLAPRSHRHEDTRTRGHEDLPSFLAPPRSHGAARSSHDLDLDWQQQSLWSVESDVPAPLRSGGWVIPVACDAR